MCTGIREWEKELLSEGHTHGKIEGLTIARQIIVDLKQGLPDGYIASTYNIDLNEVSMFKESLQI